MAAGGESPGVDPARLEAFRAGMSLIYKAGWWETNLSVAGLLRLPACPGDPPWAYAFAVFVDEADAVAAGFEVSEVVPVVLAAEIRGALADYAACGG